MTTTTWVLPEYIERDPGNYTGFIVNPLLAQPIFGGRWSADTARSITYRQIRTKLLADLAAHFEDASIVPDLQVVSERGGHLLVSLVSDYTLLTVTEANSQGAAAAFATPSIYVSDTPGGSAGTGTLDTTSEEEEEALDVSFDSVDDWWYWRGDLGYTLDGGGKVEEWLDQRHGVAWTEYADNNGPTWIEEDATYNGGQSVMHFTAAARMTGGPTTFTTSLPFMIIFVGRIYVSDYYYTRYWMSCPSNTNFYIHTFLGTWCVKHTTERAVKNLSYPYPTQRTFMYLGKGVNGADGGLYADGVFDPVNAAPGQVMQAGPFNLFCGPTGSDIGGGWLAELIMISGEPTTDELNTYLARVETRYGHSYTPIP